MAPSLELSLTPRETAVMKEVFKRLTFPTFSADEWKTIAANAGINEGDVTRNAKYSLANVRKKLGVVETAGGGSKTPTKSPKRKTKTSSDSDNSDDEGSPTKKTKVKTSRGKETEHVKSEEASQV